MADLNLRAPEPAVQPPGVAGDGLDPYPTYRDERTTPHLATASKPTDVGLRPSRRTYSLPMLLGLLAFALVVILVLVFGGRELATTSNDGSADGTTPAATAPAAEEPPAMAAEGPAAEGVLDPDVQAQPSTGPGVIEATPGPVDVPGGEPAPAQ